MALVLVDADHFKLYNDTYGHQAGDQALQRLAIQLSHCAMRPLDMASRIGGEEMALILYDATADYVHEVCSKLLHDINNLNIPHCAFPTGDRMSLSVGCALLKKDEVGKSLYHRADTSLYRAKHEGRNRTVTDTNV